MDLTNQQQQISDKLKLIEEEYIEIENLKIYCGTFNVNGKACDESLAPWLCLNNDTIENLMNVSDKNIDIYAIGFQELVDLNTTNLLLNAGSVEREQAWTNAINNELLNEANFKPPTKYLLVDKLKMFGLFMIVYVKQSLIEKNTIHDLFKSSVATGLMDMLGNKGSVALSMKLHETRICFVCSHFASDTEKLEKRNSDFRASKFRLKFQDEQQQLEGGPVPTGLDLEDHDFIFWFGDLNYRLDNLPLVDTIKHIYGSNFDELLKFDQLSLERVRHRVFENYQEGKIKFKPTYKYLIKSDVYEKQSLVDSQDPSLVQGKQKLPSWTDRVLWRTLSNTLKCTQIQYSSINTITISDHKPVYSLFDVEVKKINQKKYAKLYETMLKDADRKYNDELPHITVNKYEFNFGSDLLYYDVKTASISITNSGQTRSNVNILFYEMAAPETNTTTRLPPCWVSMHPQWKERVEPGSTYTVELSTCFSVPILRHINQVKKLEDFLIVKCLNGNDVFVTVSGIYKPTIIGWSLKCLSQLSGSFEAADQKMLVEVIETEIDSFEAELDQNFTARLRINSAELQKEKLHGIESTNSNSILGSKLEAYHRTLQNLKETIVGKDPYFANDLSEEYRILMDHLIERCAMENNEQKIATSSQENELTIEEEKNQALLALSNRDYSKFKGLNLDLELLVELLYDLLYALPHPLVPQRMADMCSYSSDLDYEQAKWILNFIPKSHAYLFELISKFLGVYLKCFMDKSGGRVDSSLSQMLAEAMFQLDKNSNSSPKRKVQKYLSNSGDSIKGADCKAQNAVKFLNLFVNIY